MIKSIIEATGASIDINDDGVIKIAATAQSISDDAKSMIEEIKIEDKIFHIVHQNYIVGVIDE